SRALPADAAVGRDVDLRDLAFARPGEAADFVQARPLHRLFRAREGDDRLGIDEPGEAANLPVFHQLGVFRGLLAGIPGLIADLAAAHPLYVHVALPARHDQAQRIALL